ncbi:MAG TPA: tetratricopeptide repeat protein [Acidobacteriota bacterium]|nr:tetratricopeptide repeat protein [Acidobacteriota bacterium]
MATPTDRDTLADIRRAVLAVAVWVAALAAASLFPDARLWGLHLPAVIDPALRWVCVGFVALALVCVAVGGRFTDGPAARERRPTPWYRSRLGGAVLVVTVGVAAWLLRAREAFLGDGTLRANDAMEGAQWYPSELLPTYLASWFGRVAPESWSVDGFAAVGAVSIAAAIVLTACLWWLVPKAASDGRRIAILWILTFGSVRLLAGYVETYTLAFAVVTLWTLAAVACRNGRLGWWWVVILWALALASHITAILLIPATAWLLWITRKTGRGRGYLPLAVYVVVALIFGGVVVGTFGESQVRNLGVAGMHFLVPLWTQAPHYYGLVSLAHLLDLLNHWWLLAPGLLVALLLGIRRRRRRDGVSPPERSAAADRLLRSDRVFWLLAAGVPLAAGCVIDPKLGWARDWDLFCLLAAPALAGSALWLACLRGVRARAAATVAVISAGLWLVFSVDGRAELDRFEVLLDLDPSRSDYGHEIMGQYYWRRGDHEKSTEHYQKALLVSENTRYRLNIAAGYLQLDRLTDSERWYRGVVARDSTSAPGQFGVALVLDRQGRWDAAYPFAERAVNLEPGNPLYRHIYAKLMMERGDPEGALPHFEEVARTPPFDAVYIHDLGSCYLALRRLPEAEVAFAQALKRVPGNPTFILDAARVAILQRNVPESGRLLNRYRELVPPPRRHPDFRPLADSLARLEREG